MPFSFLNPGLLFGGVAAAVPLILHLLRNRRVRRVPFSDLRFLRGVEVRRSRTAGLRRWLLLLLRMLAILLLAGGAARPRLDGIAPAAGDRVSLLVILDASASMQAVDGEGRTRFEEALETARDLTAGLPDGSEVQWLRAEATTQAVFGSWLPARAAVDGVPETLSPGDGTLDAVALLRGAADAARSCVRPPLVVVISDYQAVDADDRTLQAAAAQLVAVGVHGLEALPVGETVLNGAVLGVELPVRTVLAGETVRVTARVRPARDGQIVRLELDGRVVGESVTGSVADGEATVTFALAAPEAGLHPGRVTMARDRAPADDQRAFVLEVRRRVRTLLAHGTGRDDWRFLAHALAPGFDSAETSESTADLLVTDHAGWSGGDLDRFDVLVLVDPEPLGRDRLTDLSSWLRRGGGCWIVSGDPARGGYLRDHLLSSLAPATVIGQFHVRGEDGAERMAVPTPVHALLEGLPGDALATLGEAEWNRSWRVRAGLMNPVATLAGGDPLLLAGEVGEGRLLLLASGLDRGATTLADNAMFPPLVQRAAVWLGAGQGGGAVLSAGEPLSLPVATSHGRDLSGDLELVYNPADATRSAFHERATLIWSDGRPRVEGPAAPGAGAWILTDGLAVLGAATTVVPAAESDPSPGDPSLFEAGMQAAGLKVDRHLEAGSAGDLGTLLAGRDLSAWCFLAAAMALLIETWYSRGEAPRRSSRRT